MQALMDSKYACYLLIHSIKELKNFPTQWKRFIMYNCEVGYSTLPIVMLLSIFIGGILTIQLAYTLNSLPSLQNFLGSIIGLSMCRELGPLLTAILLAGRLGSAITAELASMSVYQEIDALKTMNISPIRLLVMPRILAGLCMMPFLVMFSNLSGWIGGAIVVRTSNIVCINESIYWRTLKQFVTSQSINNGLIKGEVFALVVILLSCSIGLRTNGGPREIGHAVTSTMVQCLTWILVFDYILSRSMM